MRLASTFDACRYTWDIALIGPADPVLMPLIVLGDFHPADQEVLDSRR